MSNESIVTREGSFMPDTPAEAKLALCELLGEMQRDDGGDHASIQCLRQVAADIPEEQGLRPIPEALPGRIAVTARQITAFEVPSPFGQ
ncbi:hypothetical protein KDA06_03250 [Candidatus Saccharibacteria bacterium]|nr:hypothetical protein [Candidatus Saccharibacteria bacterium]